MQRRWEMGSIWFCSQKISAAAVAAEEEEEEEE
jgi:hypothetical protein